MGGSECRRDIFVDSELPYLVGLTKLFSNESLRRPPDSPMAGKPDAKRKADADRPSLHLVKKAQITL